MTDLELFRAGDESTFQSIVAEHQDLLRSIVRRYLGSAEDARDIVQLVFTRAFEHRSSFRGESSLRTWLCRIAINLALKHRRKHPPIQGDVDLEDVRAFTHSLETSKLVAAELWQKVERHLQTLPPKQRLVVELRLFHELSFAEIGDIADCSEAAARVNFAHGAKALRSIV